MKKKKFSSQVSIAGNLTTQTFLRFRVKVSRMHDNNTVIEFEGILIPFLSYLELLTNQTIVAKVDKIGCHFAWETGYSRTDATASIQARTLELVSELLSSVVIIDHQPSDTIWG